MGAPYSCAILARFMDGFIHIILIFMRSPVGEYHFYFPPTSVDLGVFSSWVLFYPCDYGGPWAIQLLAAVRLGLVSLLLIWYLLQMLNACTYVVVGTTDPHMRLGCHDEMSSLSHTRR